MISHNVLLVEKFNQTYFKTVTTTLSICSMLDLELVARVEPEGMSTLTRYEPDPRWSKSGTRRQTSSYSPVAPVAQ